MGNSVSIQMPWVIFFTRPLSILLIVLSVVSAAWPIVRSAMKNRKEKVGIIEAYDYVSSASSKGVAETTQKKLINTDYISGIVVLAVTALFYLQIGKWSKYAIIAPQAILIVLFVLGVILLIKGRYKPEKASPSFTQINRSLVFFVVIGLLWVFLMNTIGFVVTSMIAFRQFSLPIIW